MATASVPKVPPSSTDERIVALELALASQTLARTEQLRGFLRYVCELEIAGRGPEITESLIAREVLGRSADYSPVEDATVRNRAHALRKKLEGLYAAELAEAPLRIELPKGSYRPRFVSAGAEEIAESPPIPARSWKPYAAGALGGILIAALAVAAYTWLWAPAPLPGRDPVVRDVWGPLLAPDANTLVWVGTPLQLFVRPYPPGSPPNSGEQGVLLLDPKRDEVIYRSYARRHELPPDQRLFANMTNNSPLWGDGIGALLASQVLSQAGASYELWPERSGSPNLMRGRNLILFAREEYSESAKLITRNQNFYIDFSTEFRNVAVFNRKPKSGEPAVYPLDPPGARRESYGLITVMPSPGLPDRERRTVLISGLTSAGIQAAAEFFSSPKALKDLRDRFRAEGYARIPAQYQVVIRTTSIDTMPRTWSYQTHRVVSR